MKPPPFKLSIWQKVLIWIIAIALLLIPTFYIINFRSHPISDDTADWGTFGDFIGGILNPIIALLTLGATIIIAVMLKKIDDRNLAKERQITYLPDLVLDQPGFYTYTQSGFTNPKPVEFSETSKGLIYESKLQMPNEFGIKIHNIGIGSAKNIVIGFEIDTVAIISLLEEKQKEMAEDSKFKFTYSSFNIAGLLKFEYPSVWNRSAQQLIEKRKELKRISRILSEEKDISPTILIFPDFFLELYCCYLYIWNWWLQNKADLRPDFLPIFLNVKYSDILDNTITKKIKIQFQALTGGMPEYTNIILTEEIKKEFETANNS